MTTAARCTDEQYWKTETQKNTGHARKKICTSAARTDQAWQYENVKRGHGTRGGQIRKIGGSSGIREERRASSGL